MRLAVMAVLGVALAGAAYAQAPDLSKMDLVMRSVPDGPVVKVNGVNVGKEEFGALYGAELMTYTMRTGKQPDDAARLQTGLNCVNLLVQREILRQEAARRKITVSDEELQKNWQTQIEKLRKQLSQGGAGQLSEADVLAKAGADKQKATAELRETMLIEKMRAALAKEKNLTVSDADVQTVYDQNKSNMKRPEGVHIQRIYVNTRGADEKKKALAQERINNALARIKAGESFENVAKAVTDAPDKERGGDPGVVAMSGLPPSYVQKIMAMKPGETSDIFEDDLGYHIIRLIEVLHGGEVSADDVKPMIRARLMEEKLEKAVQQFCQPLIAQPGYVHVYLELDKVLAVHPQADELRKKVMGNLPQQAPTQPTTKPAAKPPTNKSAPAKPKSK